MIDSVTVPDREFAEPIQDLFSEALRNRPDLNQAGIQVENAAISLTGSLNALRPELDVVGILQNSSLSGDLNPLATIPPGASYRRWRIWKDHSNRLVFGDIRLTESGCS